MLEMHFILLGRWQARRTESKSVIIMVG